MKSQAIAFVAMMGSELCCNRVLVAPKSPEVRQMCPIDLASASDKQAFVTPELTVVVPTIN